jgi:hypothetical protein
VTLQDRVLFLPVLDRDCHWLHAAAIDSYDRMLVETHASGTEEPMMDDPSDRAGQRRGNEAREPARYDRDLYSWAVEQAALLRAGRIAEADALNIAEEIDDVGNEQYDKLESALRIILLHLLKWDYQPERRSRSWWASITVQRKHVLRVLHKNPGLKPLIDEAVVEAYETARIEAIAQTSLDDAFPPDCPYSWREITERPVKWPE